MTEKEKEIIIDALESGIALNKMYLERIEYLHSQFEEDDESDKKLDYFITIIETKRRIKTLKKLIDQNKSEMCIK